MAEECKQNEEMQSKVESIPSAIENEVMENKNGIAKKVSLIMMTLVILVSTAIPIFSVLIMKDKTPAMVIWIPLAIAALLTLFFVYIVADGLKRKAILDFMVSAKQLYPEKDISHITPNGLTFTTPTVPATSVPGLVNQGR